MRFQEYLTTKNIIFLLLVIVFLKFLPDITAIALLFFASYVMACSLNPFVDKLSKKINRYAAAGIVILGVITISIAFFVPIIFVAIKQIQGFISILPCKLSLIQDYIYNHEFYGHKIPEMFNLESIIKTSSPVASGIVNQSINITISFAQGIIYTLAVFMIVFYLLADRDIIKQGFISIFPNKMKDKAEEISENISQKVGGYVIAQILNMIGIGFLTAIGLFLVKVDYALLLGLVTGVLDIIPIVGPTIALILCLLMANQAGPLGLFLVIVAFLTAQWLSNNLVRPLVFGKFLDLHPLIIIFALLVAAQFLGVWGVILAPAIAAMVCVVFDEVYIKTVNDKGEE